MPLDFALEKALKDIKNASPYVVAAKSGCDFAQGKFLVPFFHLTFHIYHPELKIERADDKSQPAPILQLVLLHYLLTADGTPVADRWITYRHLPGAELFAQRFDSLAIRSLVEAFGNNLESFRRAALAMGGIPMSRTGDASFRFIALPRIPVACALYLGDEEVPSAISILFDAAAPHYLPTEDLSYLGIYLGQSLKKFYTPV